MSEISHIVKSYEEELQNLNDNLIKMGSLVEKQLSDSMEAIIKVDKEAADNIIKNDAKINELRAIIEEQIVTVLVKRAPMAIDLRLTISTLKISSDLERIGDLAKKAGVSQVKFDRGGYLYHGRVKSLAEGAREGGLKF